MESDIKLLDRGVVQVDGRELLLLAHDIKLDNADRRSGSGHRRALVHDHADGLTINYNGDYPGGVTIKGILKIDAIEIPRIERYFGHSSLISTISVMKQQIDSLQERIEALSTS
ncbi:MAG: hypothetical protein WA810_11260 [Maribacter sp.]